MPALKTNPAQSLGGGSRWKMYVMLVVGIVTWIIGLFLNLLGLDIISEILYWIIWFFVYMNDIPKWIANPKVIWTGLFSLILGSLPGIGFIPWDTIAQLIIGRAIDKKNPS